MDSEQKKYDNEFEYKAFYDVVKPNQERLSNYQLQRIKKRYLTVEDLKDPGAYESALPKGALYTICNAKYAGCWKGINIMKDCMTLNLIHNIFCYLRPKTVLDFGSYTGASAVYYADQLDLIGVKDYKLLSYDVSHDCLHPSAKEDQRITFTKESLGNYKTLFPPEFLKELEHPIFISEDAHFNTVELLSYLNEYLEKGDFIVIEDLHPEMPDQFDFKTGKFSSQKQAENLKGYTLIQFLEKNPEWRVDNYFASFFGQYATPNGYGYLTKI